MKRCTALAALLLTAAAPPAEGLWSYQTHYQTGLAGELRIERHGSVWRATLAGQRAAARANGRTVLLRFPGQGGAFRGTIERGLLHGFWVRRAVTEDPLYPFGQALSYATVLDFRATGKSAWRAEVRPLEDTFSLYLKTFRAPDGTLKAAFRNPEQNSVGPAMQLDVAQQGDVLTFTAAKSDNPPLTARLLPNPDRVALRWPDLGRPIALMRTTPEPAQRFSARPPGSPPYAYRMPEAGADGWPVARAGDLGMDEAALAKVVQRIIDVDPAGPRPWLIHSIAIAYRGKLVLDEYFYGFGRDEPHDTRSASKTFSALVLGGLKLEGNRILTSDRVFPAMGSFANPDPRKRAITLGHLMTHSAGLDCDDNAETSPGNEDMIESDRTQPDWVKRTLDLPMRFDPGAHYAYCSMNMNLAGAYLSRRTGEWLPALFDRTVARPLRFGTYSWNVMPNGEGYLGGGAFVRTRDFLKIGDAYLHGGVWNGVRIASTAWVKDALSPHARISPTTTGLSGDAFRENYWETDDGWAWHMIDVKSGDRTYRAFHANGNGGQLLLLLPEFDLAVMFTAGNYGQGLWNRERDDIVGGMIIPALPKAAR